LVGADNNRVMAHRCDWRGNSVLALHNLSDESCEVGIELEGDAPKELNDVLSDKEYSALTPAARAFQCNCMAIVGFDSPGHAADVLMPAHSTSATCGVAPVTWMSRLAIG
jgi:hypothetical protein